MVFLLIYICNKNFSSSLFFFFFFLDFVQLRFVSLAFKTNEWDYILTEIRRVLRDGGVLQCIDLDMQTISDDQDVKRYLQHCK